MQTTQHKTAQVLLHPACTTNPAAVRAVQQATGQLIVLRGGKPQLAPEPNFIFVVSQPAFVPAEIADRRFFVIDELDGLFGGDAA
ncbi:hypothetical protein [Ectopseudomonas mendocina]|uniref:Uncharacterized protein n=1 Tax=Ectopseudomonas mendocina TaxID=300 RepID=A0A2R3QHK9_ECTME|nr:hypothetical protein [Pseudomonas mendocina]AVO51234.1 hypothetical protein C7A17_00095 [Pseudomonas mendocina]